LRQIGTLPRDLDPKVFSDYLLGLGVKSRVDEQPDGWLIWVYEEDHVSRSAAELKAYAANPDAPQYADAQRAARDVRRREDQQEKEFRRNYREVSDQWAAPGLRRRPLTTALVMISVVVYAMMNWPGLSDPVQDLLGFVSWRYGPPELRPWKGLDDIVHGQIWRLITPIFLHYKVMGVPILHLLFNMSWLLGLGTLIEIRRGTRVLAIVVLSTALLSNVGEYAYTLRSVGKVIGFGGMSGVVYGLFGYVWMKGRYEPEQGLVMHPNNVAIMLVWLFLCMSGMMGPVANAAHVVGLIAGVTLGLARI
jgi:GlpG protein